MTIYEIGIKLNSTILVDEEIYKGQINIANDRYSLLEVFTEFARIMDDDINSVTFSDLELFWISPRLDTLLPIIDKNIPPTFLRVFCVAERKKNSDKNRKEIIFNKLKECFNQFIERFSPIQLIEFGNGGRSKKTEKALSKFGNRFKKIFSDMIYKSEDRMLLVWQ